MELSDEDMKRKNGGKRGILINEAKIVKKKMMGNILITIKS